MSQEVEVKFRDLEGNTYRVMIDVNNDFIDRDVKRKLGYVCGNSEEEIRLIYEGKCVYGDDRVLSDYDYRPEKLVFLVRRKRQGDLIK